MLERNDEAAKMTAETTEKATALQTALRWSAAAAIAIGLSACGGGAGDKAELPLLGQNTTQLRYDQEHPITVTIAPYMLQVPVGAPLSRRDERHVAEFARRYVAQGQGDLTIGYPKDQNAAQTVAAVARALEQAGAPMSRLIRGPYSTQADGDRGVVLWFDAAMAEAPECDTPLGDSLQTFSNETPKRFGCAYQSNLAAMIADPRDLIAPRPMTPSASARRFGVLQAYQVGEPTMAQEAGEKISTTSE